MRCFANKKRQKVRASILEKKNIDIEFLSFTLFEESLLGLEVFSFLILGGGVEKMSESADRFRAINCLKWRTVDSGKLKYLKKSFKPTASEFEISPNNPFLR